MENTQYLKMGNPGAEMFGCKQIIESAKILGIGRLDIYSSYTGIKLFGDGNWDANSDGSKDFCKFIKDNNNITINLKFFTISSDNDEIKEAKKIAKRCF